MQPTEEQKRVMDLFATGDHMAIDAYAGAGKTTTLLMTARANPGIRFQMCAFNRAIIEDVKAKAPRNVTASTAHGLAYRTVGHQYAHRLNGKRVLGSVLAKTLKLRGITVTTPGGRKHIDSGFLASLLQRSLERFCQTADPEPTRSHIPYIDGIDEPEADGRRGWANNDDVRDALEPSLTPYWQDLCNPDGTLPYKHGAYLKLYELTEPHVPVDVFLLDEAQDLSPVLLSIADQQRDHCQLVFVGDRFQEIYGWTGAVNAMDNTPVQTRSSLTRSFRFGATIADVANVVLGVLGATEELVGTDTIDSYIDIIDNPAAILCRTNAGAVTQVLRCQREGQAVHLVGGGSEVASFARGVLELQEDGSTRHPELACFPSWTAVQDWVRMDPQGDELRLLVGLVEEFGIPTILSALENMIAEEFADVVVSTSHKAKGREWPTVALHDDFPTDPKDPADHRLLYVASTRGALGLDPFRCESLTDLLKQAGVAHKPTERSEPAVAVSEAQQAFAF